ncbi:MAG: hypothetical protein ACM336_05015 [Acidobacteriota bacterium]
MGFLDDLENNLKAMEGREEATAGNERDRARRESERLEALAAAPHAERLRTGPFTGRLLNEAALQGHAARTKVNIAWLGSTLRLEARGRKLELRPTATGVVAAFLEITTELSSQPADLDGDPAPLVRELLKREQ